MKIEILGWKFTITPTRLILAAIAGLSILTMLVRFITGFGMLTNLSDEWPWGLWIAFDVLTGVALAGGGYSTALIVHILHRDKYHPIARGALLTSLLGYILVMLGLFLDIGQWFNFWRPFVSWGHASVLFEVFWCVSIYTTIQTLEFGEIVTEKIGVRLHGLFKKILPVLMIIGVIFPTLHQSSLGALFLIAPTKVYPLWWTEFLPVFFLMSSFFVGPAMITIESALAGNFFGHKVSTEVLSGLARISGAMMALYLLLKVYDLVSRGVFGLMFAGNFEGNMFLLEMVLGLLVPLGIVFSKWGNTKAGLTAYGVLTAGGVILNRMNTVFTSMLHYSDGAYFPSIWEFIISIGLVAIGCLCYCFIVENFNIFDHNHIDKESSGKTKKRLNRNSIGSILSGQ
ncbi:NrfD/PsrC family molybdoenzyme membrane anchor subunit [Propionispora vibrioides]|uniref:Ni/Fe-hydrogenase 2 integral membrane subunit HybB n=1 Tax=Propionispora vibrioides TaxID=112903 RepID=A0A1H8R7W9_9FIRM|nr:Ni/Fe-hydrogenase cytochrome b subunit [Propionispora vibrioides]SEO62234.1 Ni/Fe-hydrogenase 2 integral membrane subunit HybB [Propionispora vibrioides]